MASLKVTGEDIQKAAAILRKWRTAAKANGKVEAVGEIEHIMRVVSGLYAEASGEEKTKTGGS